ncbi:hypothetical protein AB751O23_AZ_00010, partial [Chlamydiales bacterium SCGC AB-751-O23]
MREKNRGIKAKVDRILAQNLFARSGVNKPVFSENISKYIIQSIKSLRLKKVPLRDKLQNIQQILDCIHEQTLLALENQNSAKIEELVLWRRVWVFEIICKELARLNFQKHTPLIYLKLPLEIIDPSNPNSYKFIKVKHLLIHKFELHSKKAKGLPYYVFLPKEKTYKERLPSICLFPGTNFKNLASIFASSDAKGPGRTLYDNSKNCLKSLLKSTGKVRLLGYSQGGAMVLRTLVDFPKWICQDPLQPSITFNSPGLENDMLDSYIKNESQIIQKIPLTQFASYADPVSKVGKLIRDVYEINPNQQKDSGIPWRRHIGCKSYYPSASISKI